MWHPNPLQTLTPSLEQVVVAALEALDAAGRAAGRAAGGASAGGTAGSFPA